MGLILWILAFALLAAVSYLLAPDEVLLTSARRRGSWAPLR